MHAARPAADGAVATDRPTSTYGHRRRPAGCPDAPRTGRPAERASSASDDDDDDADGAGEGALLDGDGADRDAAAATATESGEEEEEEREGAESGESEEERDDAVEPEDDGGDGEHADADAGTSESGTGSGADEDGDAEPAATAASGAAEAGRERKRRRTSSPAATATESGDGEPQRQEEEEAAAGSAAARTQRAPSARTRRGTRAAAATTGDSGGMSSTTVSRTSGKVKASLVSTKSLESQPRRFEKSPVIAQRRKPAADSQAVLDDYEASELRSYSACNTRTTLQKPARTRSASRSLANSLGKSSQTEQPFVKSLASDRAKASRGATVSTRSYSAEASTLLSKPVCPPLRVKVADLQAGLQRVLVTQSAMHDVLERGDAIVSSIPNAVSQAVGQAMGRFAEHMQGQLEVCVSSLLDAREVAVRSDKVGASTASRVAKDTAKMPIRHSVRDDSTETVAARRVTNPETGLKSTDRRVAREAVSVAVESDRDASQGKDRRRGRGRERRSVGSRRDERDYSSQRRPVEREPDRCKSVLSKERVSRSQRSVSRDSGRRSERVEPRQSKNDRDGSVRTVISHRSSAARDGSRQYSSVSSHAARRSLAPAFNDVSETEYRRSKSSTKAQRASSPDDSDWPDPSDSSSSDSDDDDSDDSQDRGRREQSKRRRRRARRRSSDSEDDDRKSKRREQSLRHTSDRQRSVSRQRADSYATAKRRGRPNQKPAVWAEAEPIEHWHELFELAARTNRWDDDDKAAVIRFYLPRVASEAIAKISIDEDGAYRRQLRKLMSRFGAANNRTRNHVEFRNRRQREKEDAGLFAQELDTLAVRAYPRTSARMREELVLQQFIDGLRDTEVHDQVLGSAPKSIKTAVERATTWDAVAKSRSQVRGRGGKRQDEVYAGNVAQVAVVPAKTQQVQEQMRQGVAATNAHAQSELLEAWQTRLPAKPAWRPASPDARRTAAKPNSGNCFKCGGPGHIARECLIAPGTSPQARLCYNCHEEGHQSRECPQPRRQRAAPPPSSAAFTLQGNEQGSVNSTPVGMNGPLLSQAQ